MKATEFGEITQTIWPLRTKHRNVTNEHTDRHTDRIPLAISSGLHCEQCGRAVKIGIIHRIPTYCSVVQREMTWSIFTFLHHPVFSAVLS